jgi:hypothetical protein
LAYPGYSKFNPVSPLSSGNHPATAGDYKGMTLYSSSAAYGGTIFWAMNPKNFAVGTATVNGRNSGFQPCIEYNIVKPNKKFDGSY